MKKEFGDDLVLFGVNEGESVEVVSDYVNDVGAAFPSLLLDNPSTDLSCWNVPADEISLTEYFRNRVGQFSDGPFPLQVVVGADRRYAYLERKHQPETIIEIIHNELAKAPEVQEQLANANTNTSSPSASEGCGSSARPSSGYMGLLLLFTMLGMLWLRRRINPRP